MVSLQCPVHAVCRGWDANSIIAGGGGGTARTGVPNAFQVLKMSGQRLSPGVRKDVDDSITGLVAHRDDSRSSLAAAVGREVRLLDSKFDLLGSFDTGAQKPLFRALSFSPDGGLLAAVDGDDVLHLLTVPSLAELHSTPAARAVFFKGLLATAHDGLVSLHEPTAEFTQVRASAALELTPRALVTDGELIFYAGYRANRRPRLICFNENLKFVWLINPPGSVITALAVTAGALAAATVDGDVLIFNKKGGLVKFVKQVHRIAVTSMAPIGPYVATGSLDSSVRLTKVAATRNWFWAVAGIVIVLAIVIRFFRK
jgi:WD40 repeat protein